MTKATTATRKAAADRMRGKTPKVTQPVLIGMAYLQNRRESQIARIARAKATVMPSTMEVLIDQLNEIDERIKAAA